MVHANDSTLEQAPETFNRVCVNHANAHTRLHCA
jgi:hypothetical protein